MQPPCLPLGLLVQGGVLCRAQFEWVGGHGRSGLHGGLEPMPMTHLSALAALTLDDFSLLQRVAELRNFSAVAREREVPPSQVSRALARIEARCGARRMPSA
jgi:hypothetical protein